jgi:hypothetical protein
MQPFGAQLSEEERASSGPFCAQPPEHASDADVAAVGTADGLSLKSVHITLATVIGDRFLHAPVPPRRDYRGRRPHYDNRRRAASMKKREARR